MKGNILRGFKPIWILPVLLISLALEALTVALVPSQKIPLQEMRGQTQEIRFDQAKAVNGMTLNSGTVLTDNNDPYCVFDLSEPQQVGTVQINFQSPVERDSQFQVFFSGETPSFTETKSVSNLVKKGSTMVAISLPQNKYRFLRVDFGAQAGQKFYLKSLQTSDLTDAADATAPRYFHFSRWLIYFFFLFLISLFIPCSLSHKDKLLDKTGALSPFQIDFFFLILLTVVFFCSTPVITFDTTWYHSYLDIFEGLKGITSWDPTRGAVFPVILYLSTKFFGYTPQGITITMYLFYMVNVYFIFKISELLGYQVRRPLHRIVFWILMGFLLFLNPIYFGYYHAVLTELVAATLVVADVYFVIYTHIRLLACTEKAQRLKWEWIRGGTVVLLVTIAFFLKQMFLVCTLVPYLASELLLLVRRFSWKSLSRPVLVTFMTFVVIVLGNKLWGQVIDVKNAHDFLGRQLTNEYYLENISLKGLKRFFQVSGSQSTDKEQLVTVVDHDRKIGSFQYTKSKNQSLNSFKFFAACVSKYPKLVAKDYVENYLLTCNVFRFRNQGTLSNVDRSIHLISGAENTLIACSNKNLTRGQKIYNVNQFKSLLVVPGTVQYEQYSDTNFFLKLIYNNVFIAFANLVFTLFTFLSLPIALISFLLALRSKNVFNRHDFHFLISITTFLYLVFLSLTGCTIDRYVFPVYWGSAFLILDALQFAVAFLRGRLKKRKT